MLALGRHHIGDIRDILSLFQSKIIFLYGEIPVRENSYFGILYVVGTNKQSKGFRI